MLGLVEPQFLKTIIAGDVMLRPDYKEHEALALPKSLVWRATGLAIESAFRVGIDMPVGASISNGHEQTAGIYASDRRTGMNELHAERYALFRARAYRFSPVFLGVTMEPCSPCRKGIELSGVTSCYFVLSREQVAQKGLVNPRESLLDGPEQDEAPYYTQICSPLLTEINLTLLDSVERDRETGDVYVDRQKLKSDLCQFDEITPFP